jgi:hypothetical protein
MQSAFLRFFALLGLSTSLLAGGQVAAPQERSGGDFSTNTHPTEKEKIPAGVILVKGAWSSASDNVTPLPEGGTIANNVYTNRYFGLTLPLPQTWFQKFPGAPPSDTGRYVLSHLRPSDTFNGPVRGSILVTADDMFFTPLPATNALEVVNYSQDHLPADYKLELTPTETKIGGCPFTFYAYWSPVAELHFYVLATEIRCHTVQILLTSRDTKLLESLVLELNKMKLPAEAGPTAGTGGGDVPVCIKDYANDEHVIERIEPIFRERRFNPVPVRIIIDQQGKIKHIHFLSAFPEQEKAIKEALAKWKFRPYLRDGKPVEVETGIMFGRAPAHIAPATPTASSTKD